MKLPRLQYTYVVFYDSNRSRGWKIINFNFKIKSADDMMFVDKTVDELNNNSGSVITNYKLLSVRIVWG